MGRLTGGLLAGTIVGGMCAARSSEPTPRSRGSVLVVDDEDDVLRVCSRALRDAGLEVRTFNTAAPVLEALEVADGRVDAVLTDIHMPGLSGLELLEKVRDRWPTVVVVLMTGQADLGSAVQAVHLGAYDFLLKPLDAVETLVPAVQRAIEYRRLIRQNRLLQRQLEVSVRSGEMVGSSAAMRRVHELVASVAPTDATVLVLGESGTGKELVARAVHQQSDRSSKTFLDINCAALTESVLDSELFGHVRGAFTGAIGGRRGLFEEASGGTLFLDEIGELSPTTQARLLRVLQEGEVRPLGSNESRKVDVRVIAATNRDLLAEVQAQRFRDDLYYRLNVVAIELPPLRLRREDIAPLAHSFLVKRSARIGKQVTEIAPEALEALIGYCWPGNVRELENAIERAIILARGPVLTPELLPDSIRQSQTVDLPAVSNRLDELRPLAEARLAFEHGYLRTVLTASGGSITEAARISGLDRSNFRRLMRRLGIDREIDDA